jgi:hypothetical protein
MVKLPPPPPLPPVASIAAVAGSSRSNPNHIESNLCQRTKHYSPCIYLRVQLPYEEDESDRAESSHWRSKEAASAEIKSEESLQGFSSPLSLPSDFWGCNLDLVQVLKASFGCSVL